jgi:hypothetical protein
MIDSLLSEFGKKPMSLNKDELRQVYQKMESENFISNIEKTVLDNMEFLDVMQLNPSDLGELKEDQVQFYGIWSKLGNKISEYYTGTTDNVTYIESLFSQWGDKIDDKIWQEVNEVFWQNNIEIESFNSSHSFIKSVFTYVDTQIVRLPEVDFDESFSNFEKFYEYVWLDKLKATWIPILRDNDMLTGSQYETLESKIEEWEEAYNVESTSWYYYTAAAVAVFIIVIVILMFRRRSKNDEL